MKKINNINTAYMKRIIVILTILVATINALADSKVQSGDVKVLKKSGETFSVEFDFSYTIVEGVPYEQYIASRNADWNRDWPSDQKAGLQSFVDKWNKKNKRGMKATTSAEADYRLVIKPSYIHFGSAALAWTIGFGAGGMNMSGTMELYKGSDKVLTITVENQTGKSKLTETKRFKSLMYELADDTYKDIME